MATLNCEYCGSFINDTDERCPTCGAVNPQYKRFSDGTPRTIAELQSWYRARNLPPEEVTRFFIGRDVREPRAFGIYEDNGKFIVYKNKANGQRAIRYQGRDEAYAVNELYLKLKEEILNQKRHNQQEKEMSDAEYQRNLEWARRQSTKNANKGHKSGIGPLGVMAIFFIVVMLPTFIFTIMAMTDITSLLIENIVSSYVEDYKDYNYEDYYVDQDENLYFLEKYDIDKQAFVWWAYDNDTQTWDYYQDYASDHYEPIIGPEQVLFDKPYDAYWEYAEGRHFEWEEYLSRDISRSRFYIDEGHHERPSDKYYYCDDKLYYYLNDEHSSYGTTDNTGWYIYEDNQWSYYCETSDKEALGDELWYNCDDYWVADIHDDGYSFHDKYETWANITDFSDTSWYAAYESNNEAYQDYLDRPSYNDSDDDYDWDYDSDYDWDHDSDWDSGDTDWDSDW